MVMSSTNATDASIQAVSPELILSKPTRVGSVGAGAAAAGAAVAAAAVAFAGAAAEADAAGALVAGASSAHTADADNASKPTQASQDSFLFNVNPLGLNCAGASLTRANAHGLHEVGDKNLSIAHFPGLRRLDDGLDHLVGQGILDGDFYFCLRHELDGIFRAPIDFRVPALPA